MLVKNGQNSIKLITKTKYFLKFEPRVKNSMNSHEPRVGTGTIGPGEAVFAIRSDGKPPFLKENVEKQNFENSKKSPYYLFFYFLFFLI